MTVYVALLRGINVGGRNILPMQSLREILRASGCEDVSTYIQSGNAVFNHSASASRISATISSAIESDFGFRPSVMIISANEFRAIAEATPFLIDVKEPRHLHVSFLSEAAKAADLNGLQELSAADEKFKLTERAFYLHAPSGIGRSKLASAVEKCLGVDATGRNWRTVCKILELLEALE